MWPESPEKPRPLRTGLTTGACATACALASTRLLLTGQTSTSCQIRLPKGKTVNLALTNCHLLEPGSAYAATIKDAGDDPDVTHGACVFTITKLTDSPDIRFAAAEGVGMVTREGLALAPGEPAINPVPRRMIQEHLLELAEQHGYAGGFLVAIGVRNGQALAEKTMNPRLGIRGGLSILGTTGIVRPFSCAAYIASIHQGIDVARANGISHMAACTGNASEAHARERYGLCDTALLEMGDFAGAVLKHVKRHPLARLSLVGGFGKISKLAAGHLDLHSRASQIDLPFLAECAQSLGASQNMITAILEANTSLEALKQADGLALGDAICRHASGTARRILPACVALDVVAVDRQGKAVGCYEERLT